MAITSEGVQSIILLAFALLLFRETMQDVPDRRINIEPDADSLPSTSEPQIR